MKKFDVQVLLDLVDRLTGPLRRPTQQLQALERQAQVTDRSLERLATGGGFVASGAALAAPLVLSFMAFSDLDEALNKNRVVFGENSRAVERWSGRSAESLGLAESAALSYTGTFGNLFTSMGITQARAAGLSMDIVGLSSDLASFNNTTTTDALEALRSGLVGEIEPLRRYGVNLTAAGVAQKAFAMGLTPSVMQASDIDPASKALATWQIILDQTTNAQGDFNRTADGSANTLRSIQAGFRDLGATVGRQLNPVLNPLLRLFRDVLFAANRFAEANPVLTRVIVMSTLAVATLLAVIGVGIITLATFTLATAQAKIGIIQMQAAAGRARAVLASLFSTLAARSQIGMVSDFAQLEGGAGRLTRLRAVLGGLRVSFLQGARAAAVFTASLLTNPVFLLIAAIIGLGAAFVYAWRRSDEFRANVVRSLQPVRDAWRSLVEAVAPVGDAVRRVFQAVGVSLGSIRGPLDALGYGFGYVLGFILQAVVIVFAQVVSGVVNGITNMIDVVRGGVDVVVGVFTGDLPRIERGTDRVFGAVRRIVDGSLFFVQNMVTGTVGLIVRLFGGDVDRARIVTSRVFTAIRSIVAAQLQGVQDIVSGTIGLIVGLFTGDLEGVRTSAARIWRGVLGIFTPQIQIGGFLLDLFRQGLTAARGLASSWNRQVRGWLVERFETAQVRTGALLASLGRARGQVGQWRREVAGWIGARLEAAEANFAPLLRSLRSGTGDGRTLWRQFREGVTRTFFLPWLKNENLRESLVRARDTGRSIWANVGRILGRGITLPGVDWSAVQDTLGQMLAHITNLGPQLLEAGRNLIGNLIDGLRSRVAEIGQIFDNIKLPQWLGGPLQTPVAAAPAQGAAPATSVAPNPAALGLPSGNPFATTSAPAEFDPAAFLTLTSVDPASRYGQLLVEGFARGVLSKTDVARYAVQRMGSDTEAALRDRLQIRSPSRVFADLGGMVGQGLSLGIRGQRPLITTAMRALAAAAIAVPIAPQLGDAIDGDLPGIGSPPPLYAPAGQSEATSPERNRQTASGTPVVKHFNFPNANFNLDLSQFKTRDEFLEGISRLFDFFGDDDE